MHCLPNNSDLPVHVASEHCLSNTRRGERLGHWGNQGFRRLGPVAISIGFGHGHFLQIQALVGGKPSAALTHGVNTSSQSPWGRTSIHVASQGSWRRTRIHFPPGLRIRITMAIPAQDHYRFPHSRTTTGIALPASPWLLGCLLFSLFSLLILAEAPLEQPSPAPRPASRPAPRPAPRLQRSAARLTQQSVAEAPLVVTREEEEPSDRQARGLASRAIDPQAAEDRESTESIIFDPAEAKQIANVKAE